MHMCMCMCMRMYMYVYMYIYMYVYIYIYAYVYIYIYIYTRTSRALRARSILSDLDLEASSLAERDWVCTPNLNPATRSCPHEIVFLGAFGRAASR